MIIIKSCFQFQDCILIDLNSTSYVFLTASNIKNYKNTKLQINGRSPDNQSIHLHKTLNILQHVLTHMSSYRNEE